MKVALLLFLRICQISAHSLASVKVTPNSSQFFEYEKVSVSCDKFGSIEWTVWRYTSGSEPLLSTCGSDWGSWNHSVCEMKTIKPSDSGVYWCESKHGDSSNAINITVTKEGEKVILRSPVPPLMKGGDVTLHCKRQTSSNGKVKFFKNNSSVSNRTEDQIIIHNFSHSDEDAYKCRIGNDESPPSWLLMKDDFRPASLTVSPDSSQHFEYKDMTLNCGASSVSRGWKTIRATTPDHKLSSCESWGTPTDSGCTIETTKATDSATYWCESPSRQRSNSVNITVHDKNVILQSPVLPVTEGDNVTLRCEIKDPPFNLPAAFYKDGSLIRTEPAGHMTIHHVSKSDEGLYKCHISRHGESPPSWLFVRGPDDMSASTADPTLLSVLRVGRHLVVFCPYCICTVLMLSLYCHRPTGRSHPVSMTTFSASEDDERLDQPYDDVIAVVTTEHNF